jgi:hypothetical protein
VTVLRDVGANDVERVLTPKFGDFRAPEFLTSSSDCAEIKSTSAERDSIESLVNSLFTTR